MSRCLPRLVALVPAVLVSVVGLATAVAQDATVQRFDTPGAGTKYVTAQHGAGPAPEVTDGGLFLVNGMRAEGPQSNSVAFDNTAPGLWRELDLRFRFSLSQGSHGAGLVLLSTAQHGRTGEAPRVDAWEEPNLPGCLGIGFDVHDPPTRHWFDEFGNVHDRPERQLSIHWDGAEVANRLSPVEFRDDHSHVCRVRVRFVPGGALVSVSIDGQDVYDDELIPDVVPYESRLAFGGRSGQTTVNVALDEIEAYWRGRFRPDELPQGPRRVRVFDDVILHAENRLERVHVELPDAELPVARVLLRLTLDEAPGGWDPWDRIGAVYAYQDGDEEERFEIARFITPFRRAYSWTADVTDYQSLLRGSTELGLYVDSWQAPGEGEPKGFRMSVDLDYFEGTPAEEAYAVWNLWNVDYHFGNDEDAIADAFPERAVTLPSRSDYHRVVVRSRVTGHGQWGEFQPASRVVRFADREYEDVLWTTDVFLNPCRPQAGTWKFDRAGWAPGAIVRSWDLDVTDAGEPEQSVSLRYLPRPWAVSPGQKIQALHVVESQLILYRETR